MADLKERIARRCAKEFQDGDFINLGIGLPTQVADFIPDDIAVTCHSENGFAGIDSLATEETLNVDIINSGGTYVTALPRAKFFDTAESFGLVRGGHVKYTVLGAMEVAENGDLANWIVPGKKVAGMGGAMDLCAGCDVIITMLHTQKGAHKILKKCTLPLTAEKCVVRIITEMAVIDVREDGLWVTEIHPDYTWEELQAATGCELHKDPDMKPYNED